MLTFFTIYFLGLSPDIESEFIILYRILVFVCINDDKCLSRQTISIIKTIYHDAVTKMDYDVF